MSASKLIRPSVEYKDSYLEAVAEYHAEGRYLYKDVNALSLNFDSYVEELRADRGYAHQPYQEWVEPVPETVTWLVKDDLFIGSLELRHRLNWHLEKWGGHIHFTIRPSMRGNGFGRKILLKAIPVANYLGIDQALITVAPDDERVHRILKTVGAKFQDTLPETEKFPSRSRYWLDCT